MAKRIWHDRYERDWMRAFPLGNGRIGAMVYGDPDRETLEINEESLWSGRQIKENNPDAPAVLPRLREMLFREEYNEAAALCRDTFLADPPSVRFYESMGELTVTFRDERPYADYRKELALDEAVARVTYRKGTAHYASEAFVSEDYDALLYRMVCDEPFSCTVAMERAKDAVTSAVAEDTLRLTGQITYTDDDRYGAGGAGMRFAAALRVYTDGRVTAAGNLLCVEGATALTVCGAFATNYNVERFDIDEAIDPAARVTDTLAAVTAVPYDAVKAAHITEHTRWFDRVRLHVDAPDRDDLPTDERLRRVQAGEEDVGLYILYYDFGRYLLIESSGKRATLPANLQGKWCHGFTPPWGSDYHTNINLQMNYWPAEVANMSDTVKPLIHFMKMLAHFGEATARELYGAGGWAIHHTTDVFGRTGVHDMVQCGFFPMAGAWMCLNLWEHYEYTADRAYLEEIFPVLKGACTFVCDYLTEGPDGYLVTAPSNSPENSFLYVDKHGEKKGEMFTYGATIDFEIIRALFGCTLHACALFGETALADTLNAVLRRLPPLRVSERYGTLCEWIRDYEEAEPGHRHISHLFGLFPADQINETDPVLYEAARHTVERRLAHGGGATGWSRAWIIHFFARLRDGAAAWEHLQQLMIRSTAENLFDMHPPFQIDGNFGGTSGVCEMLLQSHLGTPDARVITLLPALPPAWKNGEVQGLRARGDLTVDITWREGCLTAATVTAPHGGVLRLKCEVPVTAATRPYEIRGDILVCQLAAGESVRMDFGKALN